MRSQNGKLWLTLYDGKYEVRSLAEADLEEALDVLDESFFINENVCNACEVNLPQNKQARLELRELCRMTAEDGVSLILRHMESGRIVSVAFNKLQFAPPAGEDPFFVKFRKEMTHSPQAQCLMDYMISMDNMVDAMAVYNLDCVCELMFLATLPQYGRLGLGRALTEMTVQLTRELGEGHEFEDVAVGLRDKRPKAVTALWTSHFTQRIGTALGFKVLNTVPFSHFEYNGKRFDERIDPLHKFSEQVIFILQRKERP